jgi:MFS family permease
MNDTDGLVTKMVDRLAFEQAEAQAARLQFFASSLEVTQIALILVTAMLVGATCGYAASRRGRYKSWAVGVAPIAALFGNIFIIYFINLFVKNPLPDNTRTWGQVLSSALMHAIGIGLWGLLPAVLGSWVFQQHCQCTTERSNNLRSPQLQTDLNSPSP